MRSANILLGAAILSGALALVPAAARAEAQPHEHGHGAAPQLMLDHGKRWSTDAPLREGMTRIRAIVEPRLEQVHAGGIDRATYSQMAGAIEAQLAYIVGNCKLEPEADAVLHVIIGGIGEGVDAMNAGAQAGQGALQIVAALDNYGQYFEHPGWKPILAGH